MIIKLVKTKKIVAILFLSGLLTSCQSDDKVIKIGEEGDYFILRGPAKEFELNTYEAHKTKGKPRKGVLYNTVKKLGGGGGKYFFDRDGNLKHFMRYKNGTKDAKSFIEKEYANGKLVKSSVYSSPKKERKTSIIEYEYDTYGTLLSKLYYERAICETKDFVVYSKNVYEKNKYGDIFKNIDSSFYHYDCDDIDIKVKIRKSNFRYENGKKAENDSRIFDYDGDGNMIRINSKRDPEYTEFYPSGVRKKHSINSENYDEFDEDGYLIKAVTWARKGDIYTCEYSKRDTYGNWTEMIMYEDGNPYLITERQITYYE